MKLRIGVLMAFTFLSVNVFSQEISDTKFGKGMFNFTAKDSSFSVNFAPRIQFRSMTTWNYDGENFGNPEQNFLIRRARLKFKGFAYSPKLQYKIELGLSNRDISGANQFTGNAPRFILDAVVMWNFYENFELWVGQTKLPGNIERVISSGNLEFIDRSILNSHFNLDRDVGFQLRHLIHWGGDFYTREKFAFSQGEGRNITTGNLGGFEYTGRLELLPFGEFEHGGDYSSADLVREETPKLMMGFTYDFNDNAVKTRGNQGSYMFLSNNDLYQTDITTTFLDAMFKYEGFSLMTEYAHRNAKEPVAMQQGESTPTGDIVLEGNAFNIQAGYVFPSNYQIAARYTENSYANVTGEADRNEYTLGLSKYIVGHKLKVQTDFNYDTLGGIQDEISWRLGFDLHF
ncbi:porin [Christiangramia fulva]|uniref:Porin n=1 Tax=Christiangramia fulva TaxID=2126553 RepID=A0A2R3Z3U0_9FLAO|nr:porin [Christiangramia fulva]AVR44936.1 porin [Christiangramia fulva]